MEDKNGVAAKSILTKHLKIPFVSVKQTAIKMYSKSSATSEVILTYTYII
jgi:hypothetical protein